MDRKGRRHSPFPHLGLGGPTSDSAILQSRKVKSIGPTRSARCCPVSFYTCLLLFSSFYTRFSFLHVNCIQSKDAAVYRGRTSTSEVCANVDAVKFSNSCSLTYLPRFPPHQPMIARIPRRRKVEWATVAFSAISKGTPIFAHRPPRQNPGWKTVVAITAAMIIGPSKASKTASLLAKAPPKPACSSATR